MSPCVRFKINNTDCTQLIYSKLRATRSRFFDVVVFVVRFVDDVVVRLPLITIVPKRKRIETPNRNTKKKAKQTVDSVYLPIRDYLLDFYVVWRCESLFFFSFYSLLLFAAVAVCCQCIFWCDSKIFNFFFISICQPQLLLLSVYLPLPLTFFFQHKLFSIHKTAIGDIIQHARS